MFIHALERVPLDGLVPLQDLPEDEADRVDVHLLVVACTDVFGQLELIRSSEKKKLTRVGDPELGRLPVDGPDKRAHDGLLRLLDAREAEVVEIGRASCRERVS